MPRACSKCGLPTPIGESKCPFCGGVPIEQRQSTEYVYAASGGVAAGRGGVAVGGDVYGNITVVNLIIQYFVESRGEEEDTHPLPRTKSELTSLIGQQHHLAALSAAFERVCSTRKGQAVFLTGPAGYGRQAAARSFLAQNQGRAVSLALKFFPIEGFQPEEAARFWQRDLRWRDAVAQSAPILSERFPRALKIAGPAWLVLMAQLVTQRPNLLEDTQVLSDDPLTLKHLLRMAAKQTPILLSIEGLELATDPLWITLLKPLIEESHHDFPLLVVATVESPRPVGQMRKSELRESLWLVKDLHERRLAENLFFEAVSLSDVVAYIGQAQPAIPERLWTLTDGIPLLIEVLWREWRQEGAVVQRDGLWRTAQPFEAYWVWGDAKDLAESRLAEQVGEDSPFDLEAVKDILRVAALEGELFTAESVAQVLKIDLDQLIDFFDDHLVGQESQVGILEDRGFQTVERNDIEFELHRYAFRVPYTQHVWLKYIPAGQRKAWSLQIACELEILWWPNPRRIARTLVRLFREGGDETRATDYQQAADFEASVESLEWHARFLEGFAEDAFELMRLFQLQMELGNKALLHVHWNRALQAFQAAEATCIKTSIKHDQGAALNGQGLAYLHGGILDQGMKKLQQALAIAQEVGDRGGEGATLNNIGGVYDALGQKDKALATFQQALAIHREVGNRTMEGTTLNNIGGVYDALGQKPQALETYQQALAIRREVGDRGGEGATLNNIGRMYDALGQKPQALETYQQALAIHREVGNRTMEGTTLNNIGGVYSALGQKDKALETYQQALAITREVGDRGGEGATLNNIGEVYRTLGRTQEALETFQQALAIHREVGNRTMEGTTLNNIGLVYSALGQKPQALATFQQALAITREVGDRRGEGATLNNIGLVYDALGQKDKALETYQQALAITREVGDRYGEGITLWNIGDLFEKTDRLDEAETALVEAVAALKDASSPQAEQAQQWLDRVRRKLAERKR
ncbi:MAG TPA: tetratricopeptide repeat protein [Anaerolineae bacterium]|nr:tetratricopeptide repeat protein [Anaerolineae bacterium]